MTHDDLEALRRVREDFARLLRIATVELASTRVDVLLDSKHAIASFDAILYYCERDLNTRSK